MAIGCELIYLSSMSAPHVRLIKGRMGSRIASLGALIFLFGSAIALQYTTPFQERGFGQLSDFVKAAVRDLTLANFVLGGLAFATWLTVAVIMGLAVFAVCLLVEVVLDGPPKSWRVTLTATALQGVAIAYLVLLNPFVARILPDTWGLQPVLRITQASLPDWVAPGAPVLLAVLSLFVFNLSQYWAHRAQHAIPWLWRFHAVHHSVRDMDSMNSYTHPIDSISWQLARSTLLLFIVIDFQMLMWIGGMIVIHDRFLHTRAKVNFGVFKNVLIDNRHHFIHHSTDPRDFDKNFSAWFTFWDKVFGTYAPPRDISLITTGLEDRKPPQTLWQFVSGRLEPDSQGDQPPPLTEPHPESRQPGTGRA